MNNLAVYENKWYGHSKPDYVIAGLEFIKTCEACPEQYDVVLSKDDLRYQVGYVRLRHGRLTAEFPDVGGSVVYSYTFYKDDMQGCFYSEEDRLEHLEKIARVINARLGNDKPLVNNVSDRDTFIAFFKRFNIPFVEALTENTLFVETDIDNRKVVDGYTGFYCAYYFTDEGKFQKMFIGG